MGSGDEVESVQLKNKRYPTNTKRWIFKIVPLPWKKKNIDRTIDALCFTFRYRILIKEVGLFVLIEVPDLGVQIYWDKGTRVTLQLDKKWKNHVRSTRVKKITYRRNYTPFFF